MKTKLLFYLLPMLLILNNAASQDQQWLILNGLGKTGYSGTLNTYGGTIGLQFNLIGVSTPNIGAVPNAKNDVFIIYSDGTHFNSRITLSTGIFYNGIIPASTVTSHIFNKSTSGTASFMYLTNRYEGDDIPTGVKLVASGISNPVPPAYILPITSPPKISANHVVVFDRELTIVVDYQTILNENRLEKQDSQSLILKFDGVQRIWDGQYFTGLNILDLKPVFGNTTTDLSKAIYPNQLGVTQIEQITLIPANINLRYVNLKPNANALNYGPDSKGNPTYNAVFTVVRNGITLTPPLLEPLSFSYDPNYLAVKAIAKTSDGGHMITYHLEFENTSDIPESKLAAQVDFPAIFELNSIKDLRWSVGGLPCQGDMSPSTASSNRIDFAFKNHPQLIKCNKLFPNQGKGFVEFKVKVNSTVQVQDLSVSLELDNPTVFFGLQDFLIEEFRDLRDCNVRGENAAFGDSTRGNVKVLRQDKSNAPPLSGDVLICYRPISAHGQCQWWGIACWIWMVIAIGILICFLIWIIARRRKPAAPNI
ncbi:MAG: hypothetical protein M3R25_09765 [Bacteroidota bacterium]|nr:hypothetical protein [Bacteroidota bacterium]